MESTSSSSVRRLTRRVRSVHSVSRELDHASIGARRGRPTKPHFGIRAAPCRAAAARAPPLPPPRDTRNSGVKRCLTTLLATSSSTTGWKFSAARAPSRTEVERCCSTADTVFSARDRGRPASEATRVRLSFETGCAPTVGAPACLSPARALKSEDARKQGEPVVLYVKVPRPSMRVPRPCRRLASRIFPTVCQIESTSSRDPYRCRRLW